MVLNEGLLHLDHLFQNFKMWHSNFLSKCWMMLVLYCEYHIHIYIYIYIKDTWNFKLWKSSFIFFHYYNIYIYIYLFIYTYIYVTELRDNPFS